MDAGIVILISLLYLILLFGIAIYGNKMSKAGQSIVNNPLVYSLSLAVYCTVWTYYGSVGRAAETGLGFVAVYLGPTIMAPIWYMVMRKMILISKQLRVTSIADFLSSRYGKSTFIESSPRSYWYLASFLISVSNSRLLVIVLTLLPVKIAVMISGILPHFIKTRLIILPYYWRFLLFYLEHVVWT